MENNREDLQKPSPPASVSPDNNAKGEATGGEQQHGNSEPTPMTDEEKEEQQEESERIYQSVVEEFARVKLDHLWIGQDLSEADLKVNKGCLLRTICAMRETRNVPFSVTHVILFGMDCPFTKTMCSPPAAMALVSRRGRDESVAFMNCLEVYYAEQLLIRNHLQYFTAQIKPEDVKFKNMIEKAAKCSLNACRDAILRIHSEYKAEKDEWSGLKCAQMLHEAYLTKYFNMFELCIVKLYHLVDTCETYVDTRARQAKKTEGGTTKKDTDKTKDNKDGDVAETGEKINENDEDDVITTLDKIFEEFMQFEESNLNFRDFEETAPGCRFWNNMCQFPGMFTPQVQIRFYHDAMKSTTTLPLESLTPVEKFWVEKICNSLDTKVWTVKTILREHKALQNMYLDLIYPPLYYDPISTEAVFDLKETPLSPPSQKTDNTEEVPKAEEAKEESEPAPNEEAYEGFLHVVEDSNSGDIKLVFPSS
jgi:hypothetical protein